MTRLVTVLSHTSLRLCNKQVGRRQLFIAHGGGLRELPSALVVLDFFVAASVRRRGLGRHLFDAMIRSEHVDSPSELAYVR